MGWGMVDAFRSLPQWAGAIRTLPENALACALLRVARRRRQRLTWFKAWGAYLILFFASLALGLGILLYEHTVSASIGNMEDWTKALVVVAALSFLPPYVAWMLRSIAQGVADALAALGRASKRRTYMMLDELSGLTMLSDAEIVVGAVRALVPPLWISIAVGAVGVWLGIIIVYWLSEESIWVLWELAILGPLTVLAPLLSGMLACLAIVLFYFALGRGLVPGITGTAAGIAVIFCTLTWILFGTGFMSGSGEFIPFHLNLPAALLMPLAYVALVTWWLASTKRRAWLRATAAVAAPFTGPLSAMIVGAGAALFLIPLDWLADELSWLGEWVAALGLNYIWSWGISAPYNPLAIPLSDCVVVEGNLGMLNPLRWLWLLVWQAVVVVIFAHHARDSVARWRRGDL